MPGKNSNRGDFLGGGGISTEKLIELVQNAKRTITIQTPYLVTTELGENLLKAAIDKGVRSKYTY